jgi:protein-tyrosine kinase
MSRLLDALQRSQLHTALPGPVGLSDLPKAVESDLPNVLDSGLESVPSFNARVRPETRLEALTTPQGFAAEQFRALAARLQHLAELRRLKTILVTSESFQEGKSLVSLNLAVTLAKRWGKKVLLMECDLRRPVLSDLLGLPPHLGISDWIRGKEQLTDCLCRIADLDLWLLPTGTCRDQPIEIVQSPRMRQLLGQVGEQFDWVLLDSAPLLVADSTILSRATDGTLLVARQECTRKKTLKRSLAGLVNVLGFVLNDAKGVHPREYEHYYSHARPRGNRAAQPSPSSTQIARDLAS